MQLLSAHSHAIVNVPATVANASLSVRRFSLRVRKSAWLRAARISRSSCELGSIEAPLVGGDRLAGGSLGHPPEQKAGGSPRRAQKRPALASRVYRALRLELDDCGLAAGMRAERPALPTSNATPPPLAWRRRRPLRRRPTPRSRGRRRAAS